MEKLPKDVTQEMALNLSPPDLVEFCASSKQYNKIICQSETFWRRKLEKDYPEAVYDISYSPDKTNIIKKQIENPKQVYIDKFTSISRELEELVDSIINTFYGQQFHSFFNQKYRTDFFKSMYEAYEEVKKLDIGEDDEDIIVTRLTNFLPIHAITMTFDEEDDDPYERVKGKFESMMINEHLDHARRRTLKKLETKIKEWERIH